MTVSGLPLLRAPNLPLPHAFSTRAGGVSAGPYAGLNLDDRGDDPRPVAENRARLAAALGFGSQDFARLHQVHGVQVVHAQAPGVWEGDALVTRTPGVLLAIGTADCYPLLLADVGAGVIGAAHAGWKGTVGRIGQRTVEQMVSLGARPEQICAAVGPGICGERYEVGEEVTAQFRAAGLGEWVLSGQGLNKRGLGEQGPGEQEPGEQEPGHGARAHLDLAGANRALLEQAGVGNVWVSGRCSTEADFYSYRRDNGQTGRMWAVIGLPHGKGQG